MSREKYKLSSTVGITTLSTFINMTMKILPAPGTKHVMNNS